MKSVHWIIDTCIVKNHEEEFARLQRAMKEIGAKVTMHDHLSSDGSIDPKVKRNMNSDNINIVYGSFEFVNDIRATYTQYVPFTSRCEDSVVLSATKDDAINLVYGTHGHIRNMRDTFPNVIRAYCPEDRLKCSNYYTKIPSNLLLNAGGFFMPWKLFRDGGEQMLSMLYGENDNSSDTLFVRPDSGVKTFAGTVIKVGDWAYEINSIEKLSSVMDNTMCYVSRVQKIYSEYRFVIVDRKVISGSRYRLDGKLSLSEDIDASAFALAKEYAEHHWQPDVAYTCDVALTPNGSKIIELNSFSCAGLYLCDYTKVFAAVTQAAIDEDDGKLWIED